MEGRQGDGRETLEMLPYVYLPTHLETDVVLRSQGVAKRGGPVLGHIQVCEHSHWGGVGDVRERGLRRCTVPSRHP